MLINEPLAIALDLKVIIDMKRLESKLATDGDTLVILHTDGHSARVIVSDRFADMPSVDDHTSFLTDANGTKIIHDFWIRLNITAKEFYEKLVNKSGESSVPSAVKIYVDVLILEEPHVIIQTVVSTIYEGGPAR